MSGAAQHEGQSVWAKSRQQSLGPGLVLCLAGLAVLAVTTLIAGRPVDGIGAKGGVAGVAALALAGLQIALIALLLFRGRERRSLRALALAWLPALVWHGKTLVVAPATVSAWVGVLEASTIFWAVWNADPERREGASARVTRTVLGVMLFGFGIVHLGQHDAISGLIPACLPGAPVWPWVTGSLLVVLGSCSIAGWKPARMMLAGSFMFLSWLPLVHVGRILEAPESAFEWSFAAMCCALAGALLEGRRSLIAWAARRGAMRSISEELGSAVVATGALWEQQG